jgi:hypothetical protein
MADIRALIAGDAEQAAPVRAGAPMTQKIVPAAQTSKNVDRVAILQSEYAKAKTRLASGDTRAQGDIASLTRELKLAGAAPMDIAAPITAPVAAPITAPVAAPITAPVAAPMDARALIAGDGTIAQQTTQQPPPSPVAKHFMDAFNTIQNAKRDIGGRIAGGIDTAYSILPMVAGMVTQGIATPYYDLTGQQKEAPALGEQAGTKVSEFLDRPLGKALGITNQPAYQHPVGPVPGQVMAAIKDFAVNKGLTAEQISEQTKASSVLPYLSPETIRYYAKVASIALPEVVGMAAKPLVTAAREAMPTVVDAKGNVISRPSQPRPPSSTTMQQVQAQFEKKQAAERPADFGAAYAAATEPPLFKPPVELTPDETGVYRDASVAQIPRIGISAGFPPESAAPIAAEEAPASVGAAGVPPAMALRGSVDAALANASPELQQFVGSKDINSIHLPALETRALEEKHGVNLSVGQRLDDTQQYSSEWNRRGETPILSNHFNEQPAQIANAFETAKQKHAPDISVNADASELGQHEINGLSATDANRIENINSAYQRLKDKWQELRGTTGTDDFPVDGNKFLEDSQSALKNELLHHDVPESISKILNELKENNGQMGFSQFLKLNQKLGQKMKEGNGSERAAAFVIRQQLEKIPLVDEAAQLKPLADDAIALAKERFNVIKTNPAYKAAIKEAGDVEEAGTGESLNAAAFHKKYVSAATPESIRRMKAEIPVDDIAHQAMIFGELNRAKNAAINASERNLTPEQFASFYKTNKSALRESLSPQAMQDVTELGLLTSKIGMPKTGTFNYSNTYSSMLGDMAKEGLLTAGEAGLALKTAGMSTPVLGLMKQFMGKMNKEGFAREATNPHGGLTKD